ncbi:BTB/POZ domain protein (macronuclear) [Tetrahymena thermophila SB210]|uniref:BTB/POZ domain protein n=1 Tax=Tetrahymena thermophila (strain SB210) TaxID=312017 RepID=Q233U1_TETTS|nr:BTB/POZ domain protein [Tetrahymena thermophila SB210]EAR91738.1 BTB/POZ domain protein [Tetrahymena thermophila SB210]|eukprot:XP_001011983.1 BTB/POZ domain protein [Tetrahymena thermophila SB210]
MNENFEITLEVNPNLQQYFLQDSLSDIIIKVNAPNCKNHNKEYKLQKGYLQLESGYFYDTFKNNPSIKQIILSVDSPLLEAILKCFYGFTCQINKKNIFDALDVCEYLQIETLQDQILEIMQENIDQFDIVKTWIISQKYKDRCPAMEEVCIKRLKQEEYCIFRNQDSFQNPVGTNQINSKTDLQLIPQKPNCNVVLMNPEYFKKALLSQGSDFQFLKRQHVFNAIKFYCEKKFSSNKEAVNDKICKMTYELINPNDCSADEYKDIFCQQIFHNYNHTRHSSGNMNNVINDPFRQSYLLQSSQQLNLTFNQTPINSKLLLNPYQNIQNMHRFSGTNMVSPQHRPNFSTSPNGFLYNSSIGADSFIFAQSINGGRYYQQPLNDEKSEKLINTFDALKESYQNFMKLSSSSQQGNQSIIESCELQVETLEQKMKRLLEEKKMRVSVLDEELKKVDEYILEQKKKHNTSMLNSNYMEDINKMLISSNNQSNQNINSSGNGNLPQIANQLIQSQHIPFHQQNDDLNEIERQIKRKNTHQRLLCSNSSDNQDNKDILLSNNQNLDKQKEQFFIQDNPLFNKVESDNEDNQLAEDDDEDAVIEQQNQQNQNKNMQNNKSNKYDEDIQDYEEEDDDEFGSGDVDFDEIMQDIDEFDHAQKNIQPYQKQTVLNTPHINIEEITNSVQMINNLHPTDNIEISNSNFHLDQSKNFPILFYETESGSHDYSKNGQLSTSKSQQNSKMEQTALQQNNILKTSPQNHEKSIKSRIFGYFLKK